MENDMTGHLVPEGIVHVFFDLKNRFQIWHWHGGISI